MAGIVAGRVSARIEGDFVVFLIGLRINRPLRVDRWLPAVLAMPRMIRELESSGPQCGFLGRAGLRMHLMAQYWRSFEHLERYARDPSRARRPAWAAFNRRMRGAGGDVGIWHETYLVRAGACESVYSDMPPFGLARASAHLPEPEGSAARARLGL